MTVFAAPAPVPGEVDASRALEVARRLVTAGVPLFVAEPCTATCTRKDHAPGEGHNYTGYHLPGGWQTSTPTPAVVDRWRPGWALCAVMGHAVDLADVDPRNGGDATVAGLQAAGAWPRSYGRAATPSGGWHDFIAPLRVGSRDAVAAGLDVKSGKPDGTGRGFAFIAPTLKRSKTTGQLAPYRWITEPDLEEMDGADDSGATLADMVRAARGARDQPPPEVAPSSFAAPALPHTGPILDGARHDALVSYAGHLRAMPNLSYAEAETLMRTRWADCAQPPHARYPITWDEARAKLLDVWTRYLAPTPNANADPNADPATARLAQLTANETERLRARRAAEDLLRAEKAAAAPQPELLTLTDLLAEPDEDVRYRINELWPRQGRVMLLAQAKAGKTTLRDNVVRSLADGTPLLDRFPVEPVADGTIAIFDVELSRPNLRRWLRDQRISNPHRVLVIPLRGMVSALDIFDETTRKKWVERLRASKVRVAILDCLGPILAAFGLDENVNRDVGRFLVAFDEMLAEAGVDEAMVIHHMGHANERGRGASRLRDWPDAEWRLLKAQASEEEEDEEEDRARYLSAVGRDVELDETQILFDPAARRLAVSGAGTRREVRAGAHLADVRKYIAGHPGQSRNKIEIGLNGEVSRKGVRDAIKLGIRQGIFCVHKPNDRDTHHFVSQTCLDHATSPNLATAKSGEIKHTSPPRPLGGEAKCSDGVGKDPQSNLAVARFAAPAPVAACPCGRGRHSPGDIKPCPRCGGMYHRFGPGLLSSCPHCGAGAST